MVDRPFSDRLMWGARWGTYYLLALGAWVLLLYLLRGPAPFDRLGVTLWSVLAVYLASGLSAGPIVGAMLPLVRWRLGAVITGILAALPVGAAAAMAVVEEAPWSRAHTFVTSMISLFGGSLGGLVFRHLFYAEPES